jgi:peptidoglycan/xylan/chitin deacetylase (PgdA/CDA1 family)
MKAKKSLKSVIRLPFIRSLLLRLTKDIPRIFIYHRFSKNTELWGISEKNFEWQLGEIRKSFEPMKLGDYIKKKNDNGSRRAPVIITVDDGYSDFYDIAYPLLAKSRVPATLFITTRFIEGEMWFWWDKLKYVLSKTDLKLKEFNHNGRVFQVNMSTPRRRNESWKLLSGYCLTLSEEEKTGFIDRFARSMDVEVPSTPEDRSRPMSWSDIAEVSKNGIEIGSHTLNHPIMTNLDDRQARREIEESKKEIEKRAGVPVETFAYPNGMSDDYNKNLKEMVSESGYCCAVVSHDGICDLDERYAITRMSPSNDKTDFLWKLYGMNHLVMKMHVFLRGAFNADLIPPKRCFHKKVKGKYMSFLQGSKKEAK